MCTFRVRKGGNPISRQLWALLAVLFSNIAISDSCFLDAVIDSQSDPDKFLLGIVDMAFVGKAIANWSETEELLNSPTRTIQVTTAFHVLSVIKGEIQKRATIKVVGRTGGCSCMANFELGKNYLIYGVSVSGENGSMELRYCSRIRQTGDDQI